MAHHSGSRSSAPGSLPAARLWTDVAGARFFILPDAFDGAAGPFELRTALGRVRFVREEDIVGSEATREAAQAWLLRHLDPAVDTLRGAAEALLGDLRRAADASRRENDARRAELGASWQRLRETVGTFGERLRAEWRRARAGEGDTTMEALADRIERAGTDIANELRRRSETPGGSDDAN